MHPNEILLERLGSEAVAKSPFLMIRHALSTYNIVSERVKKEMKAKIPGDSPEIKLQRREMEMEQLGDWDKNADLIDSYIEEPVACKQCQKS